MDAVVTSFKYPYLRFVNKHTGEIVLGRFIIWSNLLLIYDGATQVKTDKGIAQDTSFHFEPMEDFYLIFGNCFIDLSEL